MWKSGTCAVIGKDFVFIVHVRTPLMHNLYLMYVYLRGFFFFMYLFIFLKGLFKKLTALQ